MKQKTFYERGIIFFVFVAFITFDGFSQINFPNFKTVNGLQFFGSAVQQDSVLQLTDFVKSEEVGAAWYLIKQNMKNGFESSFQFRITPGSGSHGDGFAFVIQNDTIKKIDSLVGNGGGEFMGYGGLCNALAVEFDTYQNDAQNDPDANHIGVMVHNTMFDPFITPNHIGSLATAVDADLPAIITGGDIHKVNIVYNGKTFVITMDDQQVVSAEIDLQMILGDKDEAWVGFTAATGAAMEIHAIYSWTFKQGNTNILFQAFGRKNLQSGLWINHNSQNQVSYFLPKAQFVSLNLYDSQGKMVIMLGQSYRDQGVHRIGFSTRHLANGRYFIELAGERENITMPYLLIRK